jgi:hypothetical protein
MISFILRPLYPQGKSSRNPLDSTLGGLQSRSGRGGEEKDSQPLPELEPPFTWVTFRFHVTYFPFIWANFPLLFILYSRELRNFLVNRNARVLVSMYRNGKAVPVLN